ncbi:DUF2277 domain-containing protein, partial [Nocardia farcinica]|uniref:DUF2277 domain-containing protein n=1 Tax=Nocardia farcinica TaxID=37329 RepID=UPI002454E745
MCSDITRLRGLEPAATEQEIYASALQYVRKVGGVSGLSTTTKAAVDKAVGAHPAPPPPGRGRGPRPPPAGGRGAPPRRGRGG